MRAVFDLDDTICVHRNRDYVNAIPIECTIDKIRKMKQDGWEIVIYSARGQVSCKGDIREIERKNRQVVEDWLQKNQVPCDELLFGKPIGDVYVDDKGMSLNDFLSQPFCYLNGGSGKSVYRIGSMVKKDLGDDAENFKNWIEDSRSLCNHPKIISYLYNQVTMEYIPGVNLCDDFSFKDLYEVINVIEGFSKEKKNGFDISEQLAILYKNKSGTEFDDVIEFCAERMKGIEKSLIANASFCHGDMTLCNIIKAKNGLYFIDPRYCRKASSYLLDFGKLRMSLMNYEKKFGISGADNSVYLATFDEIMREKGVYEAVATLNLMYICRLYRYKQDKQTVINMAKEWEKGVNGRF